MRFGNKSTFPLTMTAQADSKTHGEILIYGDITDNPWDETDVSPTRFDKLVKGLGKDVKTVDIRICCYGGSVFAGQAIATMIDNMRKRKVHVTAYIDGIAASMGSAISQAADKVISAENAYFMIHKPSSFAWGNAKELQEQIELLDKAEEGLVNLYMRRFNGEEEELRALLEGDVDGTWLTAKEALAHGFVDEVEEPVAIAASAKGFMFNGYEIPNDVLKSISDKIEPTTTNKGGEEELLFNEEMQAEMKAMMEEGKTLAISLTDGTATYVEVEEGKLENSTESFLTAEQVKEIVGEVEITSEQLLVSIEDLISEGIDITNVKENLAELKAMSKETDPVALEKAVAYDEIVAKEIDLACKNGVRAQGETFKEETYRKMLDNLSLSEIQSMSKDWELQANERFNAGKGRQSQPMAGNESEEIENIDDYKI